MNQPTTTDTLLAFVLVFTAGMVCTQLVKSYCRSKQPPCTRHPYPEPAAIQAQIK